MIQIVEALERKSIGIPRLEVSVLLSVLPMLLYYPVLLSLVFFAKSVLMILQRRLPWQSTLQVSVSLSLVNPFLWYLIDRTRVGFWLSAAVGIAGTAFLLQTNPEMIQTPETLSFPDESKIAGSVSVESFGVTVWIASVLFCSCVCFGNIGRRFASMERNC